MTDATARALEERFLIVAPTGRDGPLTAQLLARGGLVGELCPDVDALCAQFEQGGAAGLMIAEEALAPASIEQLSRLLAHQDAWSDVTVLLFVGASATARTPVDSDALLASLGNVVLLERPLRPITMLSAARAALRARRRQYASRGELREQQRAVAQRDQFLAMLGHELRNPLSAITMALHLEGESSSARHREIMHRQVGHLTRLVDDLLDVSRVTSGKVSLRKKALDLVALAERSVGTLRPSVEKQGQTLTLALSHEPVWVHADPVRLEQVIGNLVTNASKYTGRDGRIELSVRADGDEAVVEVRDTGVGIAPEMLGRVFDLFAQVEGTLDRSKGGMGIGLTLVRSLVEMHGGSVHADSGGLGQGSLFTVRLPRTAARIHESSVPPRADHARESGARRYDVLVIEDNHDSRELLSMLLARRGHRVFTAADGPSGVEEARLRRPEVLLVDIGLPGLDGYGVARAVRELLGRDVYLVAVTGYGQPDDRRRALDAGFDLHVTKPIDGQVLESVFRASQMTLA